MTLLGEDLFVDDALTVWGTVFHVKLTQETEGLTSNAGVFDSVDYFTREEIAAGFPGRSITPDSLHMFGYLLERLAAPTVT